ASATPALCFSKSYTAVYDCGPDHYHDDCDGGGYHHRPILFECMPLDESTHIQEAIYKSSVVFSTSFQAQVSQ
ncbi:MAG: hypothetical protein EZS28_049937, partial [Streblomastix strix]